MNYFIEISDKRCEYLFEEFISLHLNVKKLDYSNIQEGDVLIFSPAKKFQIEEIEKIKDNCIVYAGNISENMLQCFLVKNITYFNFLKDEVFAIKNAKLTAEAVLALIITENSKSIFHNNVLILGGGRIAKCLAIYFLKLGVNFAIGSFNNEELENLEYFTNKCYNLSSSQKVFQNYDVIVNTIPVEFLNDDFLQYISSDSLFIEVASINSINENADKKFNYLKAPALPQRFSAYSASLIMKNFILGE